MATPLSSNIPKEPRLNRGTEDKSIILKLSMSIFKLAMLRYIIIISASKKHLEYTVLFEHSERISGMSLHPVIMILGAEYIIYFLPVLHH